MNKKISIPLVLFLFYFAFVCFSFMRVADVDLWGHLKFGEQIVREAEIPRHDMYSYTAHGKPWVDHEWLAEAVFYIFYSRFGDAGLFALKIFIGFIIALFVFLTLRMVSTHMLSLILPFCLTLLTLGHFALFRPQLFTYLFLSMFVYGLCAFHFKQEKKFLTLFPFLMMLWCNLHGGFFTGLGILFVSIFVFWEHRKFFFALFLFSCAATFLNPYGYHLHETVLRAVLNPYTHQRIVEWKSPSLFSLEFPEYTLYLLLSFLCIFLSRAWKEKAQSLFIFYGMGVLLSISSIRHIPLFALLAAPFFSLSLSRLLTQVKNELAAPVTIFFVLIVVELSCILFPRSFHIAVSPRLFPVSCVAAMKQQKIRGNVFNPFEWGEYIIFNLYPGVRVSMDGRYDTVYPWSVIDENYRVLNAKSPEGLRVPLEEKTDLIMLSREKALTKSLRKQKQWKIMYENSHCIIFIKVRQEN